MKNWRRLRRPLRAPPRPEEGVFLFKDFENGPFFCKIFGKKTHPYFSTWHFSFFQITIIYKGTQVTIYLLQSSSRTNIKRHYLLHWTFAQSRGAWRKLTLIQISYQLVPTGDQLVTIDDQSVRTSCHRIIFSVAYQTQSSMLQMKQYKYHLRRSVRTDELPMQRHHHHHRNGTQWGAPPSTIWTKGDAIR